MCVSGNQQQLMLVWGSKVEGGELGVGGGGGESGGGGVFQQKSTAMNAVLCSGVSV